MIKEKKNHKYQSNNFRGPEPYPCLPISTIDNHYCNSQLKKKEKKTEMVQNLPTTTF